MTNAHVRFIFKFIMTTEKLNGNKMSSGRIMLDNVNSHKMWFTQKSQNKKIDSKTISDGKWYAICSEI